jgi:integrase
MPTTRTVRVFVRHARDCKHRTKGGDFRGCNCPKSLLVYEGAGSGKNKMISAKTRSWEKAEEEAQKHRDTIDPVKQELKRLRAAKERESVLIAKAVALYIANMVRRLGDNGTVELIRSLLGHVDPETNNVTKNGHLFNWLDRQPLATRPMFIADITIVHLTEWRASWKYGSDLTARQRWGMVKGFFYFCERMGWIADSPARKMEPLLVKRGNRTAIFKDAQYAAILDAVPLFDPESLPAVTRTAMSARLTTFIELMRWSGMAISDAVQFRPEQVDAEGVLRYSRQKTNMLGVVQLPAHVVALLRSVPLEQTSIGEHMPFRSKIALLHDVRKWQHRLRSVFELAGITKVETDAGRTRAPHAHMLRDTFAVWHLCHGARLHAVAKMLGHANTRITEKAYLPWVQELEDAHIAEMRRVLDAAAPKATKGSKVVKITARK